MTDHPVTLAAKFVGSSTALAPGDGGNSFRLIDAALHWLFVPIEAGIALWLTALSLSLLGWMLWGLRWAARRAASKASACSGKLSQ